MSIVIYNDYVVQRHARPMVDGMFEATGTVEKDGEVVESSDPLGYYPAFESAIAAGIDWAKSWVNVHG
ncbi:hypothetical protein AWV79_17580 [Cupriavidus sp. UYMMa02A]|nr:hypothetical protein AWV79_17580 [Cupriavidus sp. UYMMa02A]